MKSKKFLIFAVLAALAVAYAFYDFQNDKKNEAVKAEMALLFSGKPDQVQRLEISGASGGFVLIRTSEGWKFDSPISETADQDSVTQFIEGISTEKSSASIGEGSSPDWKIYGLDHPKTTITLHDNLKTSTSYQISGKKNFQGDSYIRKNDENKVYVAGSSWIQKADRKADDFRDRRWARVNVADIQEMSVVKGNETFRLAKTELDWMAPERKNWKLDQNKIRKFISGLSVNRIQNFQIAPDSKPLLTLEFKLKDSKTWKGEFGVNKDKKHFLSIAAAQFSAEISSDDANDLYKVSLDGFRDRTEPFQFRRDDVKKIEFKSPLKKFGIELKSDQWELATGSDTSQQVNTEKLKTVLGKMQSLELLDFTNKRDEAKLMQGESRLVLKAGDNKILMDLRWGGLTKAKVAGLEKAVLLAKSSLYPNVFTLDDDKLKELGLEQILIDKKSDQPQNQSEGQK